MDNSTSAFQATNTYEKRDYEVGVTNGERVSIMMRPKGEQAGLACSMSTDEARRFARDVMRRANEADAAVRSAKVARRA